MGGWLLYAFSAVFELVLLSVHTSFHTRRMLGMTCLLLTSVSHTLIVAYEPLLFGIPFFVVGCYRMVNIMRFSYGRMQQDYLYRACGRTSFALGGMQTVLGAFAFLLAARVSVQHGAAYILFGIAVVLVATSIMSLVRNIQKSRFAPLTKHMSDSELPSVTVAIPARNETNELADCIKSFVDSDYQKLEILVLDDCSQDKTSDIIKRFAHAGVRFVQGAEPGDSWLAKNAAYQKLASEANGEWLLFCGVDVRVSPDAIRSLVAYACDKNLSMVSMLPERSPEASHTSVAQIVRYAWELALPRSNAKRPPVLSTLWLVRKEVLEKHGGIAAVKRKVVPEAHFAKVFAAENTYAFLRSGADCRIISIKNPNEQFLTTLRVRYPQLHKRPENVAYVTLVELLLALHPLLLWFASGSLTLVSVYLAILLVSLFAAAVLISWSISKTKHSLYILQSLCILPIDILLTHISMCKYEFSRVEWKERNVCLPVMHIVPSLPKIED